MHHNHRKKTISELRQDPVSGDWVVIATARAKRPRQFAKPKKKERIPPKAGCPFEDPQKSGHGPPLLALDRKGNPIKVKKGGDWFVQVVRNKYPAFGLGDCSIVHREQPFVWLEGAGHHEVVITRDHLKQAAYFTQEEMTVLLKAYESRYRALAEEDCVEYVMIFHNHGSEAGASIFHPHSQIIAVPVIPPDVARSIIKGSKDYYEAHGACIHCNVIAAELKAKERVIYENDLMVVIAPFASKVAFETRVFPKKHGHSFVVINDDERFALADAMRQALRKLAKGLNEPSYNFFIHTAPVGQEYFKFYHWHIEILPKTAIWAGFELGTGMEISSVAPETAASYLRKF